MVGCPSGGTHVGSMIKSCIISKIFVAKGSKSLFLEEYDYTKFFDNINLFVVKM